VPSASSSPPSRTTFLYTSRVIGVLTSLVSLALAALGALALSKISNNHFESGVVLLAVAVFLRWFVSVVVDEWGETTARILRAQWRHWVPYHLASPRREGERGRGDLAPSIERASNTPSLERLAASAATSLLGIIVVFAAAGWMALVITVGLLMIAAPFYVRAGRRSQATTARYDARRAILESRQLELLQHAPELRALGAVNFGANEIAAISDSEHLLALRAIRVALESSLVTEFLSGVSVGLVAMVVGFGLLEGNLSLVRALVAVLVTSELFSQVRRYGVEFHRRDDAQLAHSILEAPPVNERGSIDTELLVARNLTTEANHYEVTLTLREGDHVVITGPSGSGKTTLLHTILGWRTPTAGTLLLTPSVVGYVSAESALLSGTLRENLTLGAQVSDRDIVDLLTELGLTGSRFDNLGVELLADGRGISSGERVRLVIARVLLVNPSLVLLDDVAGVLDEDSRATVRRVFARRPSLTTIEATVDTPLTTATSSLELAR
jgi:ABC-type transport system involved in cytochrome bd biosynthesis fused ATPase/permease subunit